jgi:hypothetical protein
MPILIPEKQGNKTRPKAHKLFNNNIFCIYSPLLRGATGEIANSIAPPPGKT